MLRKFAAAAAGVALMMSGPAVAASGASVGTAAAAVVMQDDDGDESAFERNLPVIVAVVFTVAFGYFLYEALDDRSVDNVDPPTSP